MRVPALQFRVFIYTLCYLSIAVFTTACTWWKKQEISQPAKPPVVVTPTESAGQIQLMIFQLRHDSSAASGERCDLMSIQRFNGRLKKNLKPPDFIQPGDLVCHFQNKNGEILYTHVEADPLTDSVEAAEEDGTLKRHQITRTSAELVLRVQSSPELHQLVIGKVMQDQSIITIADIKL